MLFTHLKRQLATRLVCSCLAELLSQDQNLVQQAIDAAQEIAAAEQRPDLSQLDVLKAEYDQLKRAKAATLRNPGMTELEQAETDELVQQFQKEQAQVAQKIAALEASRGREISIPSEESLRADISNLREVLLAAARGEPEDTALLREIIDLLTGGQIPLYQMGEKKQSRGWLQARFTVSLLSIISQRSGGPQLDAAEVIPLTIDFIETKATTIDDEAEQAWAMYEANSLNIVIADELGCSRGKVVKLLNIAAEKRGIVREDGRGRRATLGANSGR